jgi:hypothetical protein
MQRAILVIFLTLALAACASAPKVTRVQELSASADAPYNKVLVVFLASTFDPRRYLETEIVKALEAQGVEAVASTSMMDSRTPVVRSTFAAMVEEIKADAVLVTQLVSLTSTAKVVDMSPEATTIYRPTYYYNVFSVETTEFVEPQSLDVRASLVLGTQLYSTQERDVVWGIESSSKLRRDTEQVRDYSVYVNEANAIVKYMSRDGLIAN